MILTGRHAVLIALSAFALVASCKTATTRPYFPPVNGAPRVEVPLGVKAATRAFADLLKADTLPLLRVEPRDGYIESAWFDTTSHRPTTARPLGPGVVRIRAWVDPTRAGSSRLTVETVFRPVADPSVDQRDLDQQVRPDHPVGARISELVKGFVRLYGEPEDTAAAGAAAPKPAPVSP